MNTPDNAPKPPRYSGLEITMLLFGVILLLPGLCSLLFMLTMISEIRMSEPMGGTIITVWVVCFAISAIGVALIYVARKDARKRR